MRKFDTILAIYKLDAYIDRKIGKFDEGELQKLLDLRHEMTDKVFMEVQDIKNFKYRSPSILADVKVWEMANENRDRVHANIIFTLFQQKSVIETV